MGKGVIKISISEKTLELNICAEISKRFPQKIIWFGLTQRQEAKAGWDACMRMNGYLFILQFKRSKNIQGSNNNIFRRFTAPHDQMKKLISKIRNHRSVFYVLPDLHTSRELGTNDLLDITYCLDVIDIPKNISNPLKKDGSPRKSKNHYLDTYTKLNNPFALIRSNPIKVQIFKLSNIFNENFVEKLEIKNSEKNEKLETNIANNFNQFWSICQLFNRNCIGGVLS